MPPRHIRAYTPVAGKGPDASKRKRTAALRQQDPSKGNTNI